MPSPEIYRDTDYLRELVRRDAIQGGPNRERSVSVIVSVHGPRDALSRVSASRRIEVPLPE